MNENFLELSIRERENIVQRKIFDEIYINKYKKSLTKKEWYLISYKKNITKDYKDWKMNKKILLKRGIVPYEHINIFEKYKKELTKNYLNEYCYEIMRQTGKFFTHDFQNYKIFYKNKKIFYNDWRLNTKIFDIDIILSYFLDVCDLQVLFTKLIKCDNSEELYKNIENILNIEKLIFNKMNRKYKHILGNVLSNNKYITFYIIKHFEKDIEWNWKILTHKRSINVDL